MNLLTSLQEHLPMLLVLSPFIGFLVTAAASRLEPALIPHFALANMLCTLAILAAIAWQHESNLAVEADLVRQAQRDFFTSDDSADSLADLFRTLDRTRTEQLRKSWFTVDGINMVPVWLIVVFAIIGVSRFKTFPRKSNGHVPILMLFQSTSLGLITASDLRVFLFLSAASAVTISLLISQGGNSSRRQLSEQFLVSQFAGGALITLGLSMLIVSIPWMKLPDSTTIPDLSWQIFSITADIRKWTSRSELAFHYENEFFPWMMLVLLCGFGVQSGLFPFHSLPVRIISESHPLISALYLAGSVSVYRIAWFRFVLPIAPEVLASFDTWMLIPSFAGAVWGALLALRSSPIRQRVAWIFISLSSLSFVGCYTMTRFGMNGAWLMQQQLTVFACAVLLGIDSLYPTDSEDTSMQPVSTRVQLRTRNLVFLICFPILGLTASSYLILSVLIQESVVLSGIVFLVGMTILAAVFSILMQHARAERRDLKDSVDSKSFPGSLLIVTVLTIATSVFPGLLLHQSNSEFVRLFRRFEQSSTANSAEIPSNEPQDGP